MERVVYLDASALVKLTVPEAGEAELRRYLAQRPAQVTSDIGRVEVTRAVNRRSRPVAGLADRSLEGVGRTTLDTEVVREAGRVGPPMLRTLDAIHLASAMRLGDALEALVTYDRRLADAASAAGIRVESPGVELDQAPVASATLDPATLQRVVDRLVGRLRPARIVLPDEVPATGAIELLVVLGPWSPGRAAAQLGQEAVIDLGVDVDLTIIDDEDAGSAPSGRVLYQAA